MERRTTTISLKPSRGVYLMPVQLIDELLLRYRSLLAEQKKEPQQKGDQATAQSPFAFVANATFARLYPSLHNSMFTLTSSDS